MLSTGITGAHHSALDRCPPHGDVAEADLQPLVLNGCRSQAPLRTLRPQPATRRLIARHRGLQWHRVAVNPVGQRAVPRLAAFTLLQRSQASRGRRRSISLQPRRAAAPSAPHPVTPLHSTPPAPSPPRLRQTAPTAAIALPPLRPKGFAGFAGFAVLRAIRRGSTSVEWCDLVVMGCSSSAGAAGDPRCTAHTLLCRATARWQACGAGQCRWCRLAHGLKRERSRAAQPPCPLTKGHSVASMCASRLVATSSAASCQPSASRQRATVSGPGRPQGVALRHPSPWRSSRGDYHTADQRALPWWHTDED